MAGLSVNDLINVQVSLSPVAAPTANLSILMIQGSSDVIDVLQRFRIYTSISQVAADFGTAVPEYICASLFFAQTPQPATCYIGRWAKTATKGLLHGGGITSSLSAFTAVTAGSFTMTIDGTLRTPAALNFSAAGNLNAVAAIINTAISSWGTCVYNAVYNRFEFESLTTGASSAVSFAGSPGSGTDVSTLIAGTSATGAQSVGGVIAETMVAGAAALMQASGAWYGLQIADAAPSNSDLQAVAQLIEASSPPRTFWVTTQDANSIVSTSTTDIGYILKNLNLNRTAVQYSSMSLYAAASLFARQSTVNYNATASTLTLMYKQEPSVGSETLSETAAAALKAKNINVFAVYQNGISIIQFGTMASGQFIDIITGADWLANDMQTRLFNLQFTIGTKIPYTDPGVNMQIGQLELSLQQAVANGFVAPGIWRGPNILTYDGKTLLANGAMMSKGYLTYAPPVSSQSTANVSTRVGPPLQAYIRFGGAIHTTNVVVSGQS